MTASERGGAGKGKAILAEARISSMSAVVTIVITAFGSAWTGAFAQVPILTIFTFAFVGLCCAPLVLTAWDIRRDIRLVWILIAVTGVTVLGGMFLAAIIPAEPIWIAFVIVVAYALATSILTVRKLRSEVVARLIETADDTAMQPESSARSRSHTSLATNTLAATEQPGVSIPPVGRKNLRAEHVNAYEPWSIEEHLRLLAENESGKSVAEMAVLHGRNEGAIRSRLEKPIPAARIDV